MCSSPALKDCPREDLPEFAFIGRSNVGKSSLINMIAGRKGLAKVSGTPGKTRLINHFKVESNLADRTLPIADRRSPIANPKSQIPSRKSPIASWFLVDLPGYGFARLSKEQREKFEGLIRSYLSKRENLACTFLLIDSRLEPQKIDLDFMNWLGDEEIPFVILFTKCDKLSKTLLQTNLVKYRAALSASWQELPTILPTSAETRAGKEELLDLIGSMLSEISENA
jgi:GTP-binding protein